MTKQAALHTSTPTLIKRLVGTYLRPYFKTLAAAMGFMLLGAAMTASFAVLMEPVMDKVLVGQNRTLIFPFGLGIALCFILSGLATYAHTILMNKVGQSIVSDIQEGLFARFMILDLAFFHRNPSGQLLSRVVNDVSAMRNAVSDSLTGIGRSFLTLLFLVGVMFYQDPKLALIAFTVFPAAAFCVAYLGRRLRKLSGNIQQQIAALSDHLSQIFHGIRQVKAYGMEDYENKRAATAIRSVRGLMLKAVRVGTLSTPINEALVGFALCGMIVYGGYQIADE
ncbi:MAG: ABC transporter permease, partial [Micavibrio sp.]